ncbi:hypothetical protein MLD38_004944 [Melastoma candidum]|uniref:Uncharacterized protein n=1 Tax=Melastoma candidum TaxID=119954 RepID=A0ACB9S7Q6_9MYRT|nr:hypothetical protein MLD38_004944 [Melastoma candidum]
MDGLCTDDPAFSFLPSRLVLAFALLPLAFTVAPCKARPGHAIAALLDLAVWHRPPADAPVSPFSPSVATALSPGPSVIQIIHHQDLNKRILVALIVASALLFGVLSLVFCFWISRRRRLKASGKKGGQNSDAAQGLALNPAIGKFSSSAIGGKQGSLAVFEYQLLAAATNHFAESNLLSEGGDGLVYKAHFSEKFVAAVKKLDNVRLDSQRGFENEVNWLSKVKHPNIATLLGYCIHGESRCLLYEMTQNGSLEEQLHGPSRGSALTWPLRMKIAVDVAKALEFLHERCSPPVVHRDLKSSNLLLDLDFNAKLCDFGLAVTAGNQNKLKIKLAGSVGYLAPEYLCDGKLTDKSDVYAFGVILLELLMGKKPVEETTTAQRQSLVTWAMPQLTDRAKLPNILDPAIRDTMDLKHLYQVAAVAVLCVQPEPSYRPLITDVLHSLIPLLPSELGGSLRVSENLSAEALKTSAEPLD